RLSVVLYAPSLHDALPISANLVNGLGNLTARIMKMAEIHLVNPPKQGFADIFPTEFKEALANYDFRSACDFVWQKVGELDEKIADRKSTRLNSSHVKISYA